MIRVLVVDDHDLVRTGISRMLADISGLQVIGQADSGEDALNIVGPFSPDLMLLDIMLPGKAGMQILEELRDDSRMQGMPVLMLTAKGQRKDREAAETAGASMFMTKPFANEEILRNVKALLDR